MSTAKSTSMLILFLTCCGSLPAQVAIIEHTLPKPVYDVFSWPSGIASGPDDAVWFTEESGKGIGRITTAGSLTEYSVPTAGASPQGITGGPDGAVWFTEINTDKIGRVTTAGVVSEFDVPTPAANPDWITSGPDGALWFTEFAGNKIGRITTAGAITEYPIPTGDSGPVGITTGPDQALWFTESTANQIGRITTAGTVTEFPISNASPEMITTGPDGALWFTEFDAENVGRITITGSLTEFPVNERLYGITSGPDGDLWFTDSNSAIVSMTTSGVVSLYPVNVLSATLNGITTGPDGDLWFTQGGPTASGIQQVGQAVFPSSKLSMAPNELTPGTKFTLAGHGFAANEAVSIYANSTGSNFLLTEATDAQGSFSVTDILGALPFSYNSFVAVGQTSGKIAVAQFFVDAKITLSPAAGTPGSTAKAECSGFIGGELVEIYWLDPKTELGIGAADANGSFVQSFAVPAGLTPGPYAVSAYEGQLFVTAKTGYDVE